MILFTLPLNFGKLIGRFLGICLFVFLPGTAAAADFTLVPDVIETGQYGWRWGGDANRDSVTAEFQNTGAPLILSVVGHDVDTNREVSVTLNGNQLGFLPAGPNNELNSGSTITIDTAQQVSGLNTLVFAQEEGVGWKWGVTSILLSTSPIENLDFTLTPGVTETGQYGWRWGGNANRDFVTAKFTNTGGSASLSVVGYDVDTNQEVSVTLNGNALGFLPLGPNDSLNAGSSITLPASLQVPGDNTLVFSQAEGSGWKWGVTNVLLVSGQGNQPPVANNDTASVGQGATASINILGNDTDSDGNLDSSSISITQPPANGSLQISNGVVSYEQDGSSVNSDSFRYTVEDNQGAISNQATVNISIVTNGNSDFTLVPGVTETGQYGWRWGSNANIDFVAAEFENTGSAATLSLVGYDIDTNQEVSVTLNGTFLGFLPQGQNESLNASTSFSIPASQQVAGTNTLLFAQEEGRGWKWGVTNILLVSGQGNQPPVASNDTATIAQGASASINVLGNDSDPDGNLDTNTIAISQQPTRGSIAISNGVLTYTHDDSNTTTDSFRYTVRDSQGAVSNAALVIISISPNGGGDFTLSPGVTETGQYGWLWGTSANRDFVTAEFQSTGLVAQLSVVGYDVDTSQEVSVSLNGNFLGFLPAGPNESLNAETTFTLSLSQQVSGVNTLVFAQEEGSGWKWGVTDILLLDSQSNQVPVAVGETIAIAAGGSVVIDVLANDSDPEGPLVASNIAITQQPAFTSAFGVQTGGVLYTHDGGNSTNDSFTYTVADDQGAISNIATVNVSITTVVNNGALTAFHRDGQTFLTWDESDPQHGYHVYRHNSLISSSNLSSATKLTSRWGALDSNTSVNPHGGSNAPANYVINELAPALGSDTGLFVYTTQPGDTAAAYYAVTSVINGVESTASMVSLNSAVTESVSTPSDVLTVSVNGGKGRIYTQYMDYSNWNPTFNGYAYNYAVSLPFNYDPQQSYPLMIQPHAYTEVYRFLQQTEYSWEVIQLIPHDPGPQVGEIHSWWYGYAADHNYLTQGSIPTSGAIENFTEQRLMRSVEAMLGNSDFNIDSNRIHAYGNSMGASGVLALGMRYGSLLSGVYANQPMTNYFSSPTFQPELEQLWGSKSDNLPIVNGGPFSSDIQLYGLNGVVNIGVWDWMNHQQQLIDRRGDTFGYLMTFHGKRDTTIDWQTQGKPFVQALTNATAGFSARHGGTAPHSWAGFASVVQSLFGFGFDAQFPWKYDLDLSFPAIQNASGSGNVNPANSGDDRYNMNIEWATPQTPFAATIVDQPTRYEISVRSTSGAAQTADITPRRTQQFLPNAGQQCSWTATNGNSGQLTGSGNATVDIDSLLTISGVSLATGSGTRLQIDCP